MALPRITQSKTVMKIESGKSVFAGERSSQRNCLPTVPDRAKFIAGSPLIEVAARIMLGHIIQDLVSNSVKF